MNSQATERFWKCFWQLPDDTRKAARNAYRLWRENPYHDSLRFKQIHPTKPVYSVRIGLYWRSVGVKDKNTMIWFWIGSHADYNNLVSQL